MTLQSTSTVLPSTSETFLRVILYAFWWKVRRGNPTNQQGQVQGAFYVWTPSIPNNTRSALLSDLRGARYGSSPIRQGFEKNRDYYQIAFYQNS